MNKCGVCKKEVENKDSYFQHNEIKEHRIHETCFFRVWRIWKATTELQDAIKYAISK